MSKYLVSYNFTAAHVEKVDSYEASEMEIVDAGETTEFNRRYFDTWGDAKAFALQHLRFVRDEANMAIRMVKALKRPK